MTDTSKSERPKTNIFLFWKHDPSEIERQVDGYSSLPVWKRARGISALLFVLSATLTVALSSLVGIAPVTAYVTAAFTLTLAFFMFRGARWAFFIGIGYWTLEKAAMILDGAGSGRTPIVQVLWWLVYMHAFMFALSVEKARNARAAQRTSAPPLTND